MTSASIDSVLHELDDVMQLTDPLQIVDQITKLLQLYRCDYHASLWKEEATLYTKFCESLIGVGLLGTAFRLAHDGSRLHQQHQLLRYQCALALAQMGDIRKAERYANDLFDVREPSLRIDVLSLRGRLFKDRHLRTRDPGRKQDYANKSAEAYSLAFEETRSAYPAINAATMFLIFGAYDEASRFGREALQVALEDVESHDDHWTHATIAQAQLILGEVGLAEVSYQAAIERAGGKFAHIASMQKNAKILCESMRTGSKILNLFGDGCVAICLGSNPLGHLIPTQANEGDDGCRPESSIRRFVAEQHVGVGYCCPRPGVETLFGEAVIAAGADLHVVLPFSENEFLRIPGMLEPSENAAIWRERSKHLIDSARKQNRLHFATQERFYTEDLLIEYSDCVMQGLAVMQSEQLNVGSVVLSISESTGNEANDFKETFESRGWAWHNIDIRPIDDSRSMVGLVDSGRELKAMLFADLKNFSTLPEYASSSFFRDFNNFVNDVIQQSESKPIFRNSWGDGLHFVFDGVIDAARFAVHLLETFERVDFDEAFGLPSDTQLRIGMHYGPVFPLQQDPILKRDVYVGSHVTRAARIEPVTIPGCIFVSEQFAAAFSRDGEPDLICISAGIEKLAKGYDTCSVFWLGRR